MASGDLRPLCPGIYPTPMVVIVSWVYISIVSAVSGLLYLAAKGVLLPGHIPCTSLYPSVTRDWATGPRGKLGILTAWVNVILGCHEHKCHRSSRHMLSKKLTSVRITVLHLHITVLALSALILRRGTGTSSIPGGVAAVTPAGAPRRPSTPFSRHCTQKEMDPSLIYKWN